MSMFIRIQPGSVNWKPALVIARKDPDKQKLLGQFAHYIADIYVEELVDAVNSQKYEGKWEPLTPEYKAWKVSQGLSSKIWEATSLLKDSISVWRSGSAWVVGIEKNIRYPGSNVPVYKVARWMEYGTSRMPPRPLFRPVKDHIQRNMRSHWNDFLRSKGITP